MNKFTICCDSAIIPAPPEGKLLNLASIGSNVTVNLEIQMFRNKVRPLDRIHADFIRLAAFIYAADCHCFRGPPSDVLANEWPRDFTFHVPVHEYNVWSNPKLLEKLSGTLEFLTGDKFRFVFSKRPGDSAPSQELLQFQDLIDPLPEVDQVILFSGGADSLAAVVESVKAGHRPILVSHRSSPVIDARQKHLVQCLRERFKHWPFPHVSMWANRRSLPRHREFSQRSRSFLFSALGAVVADLIGIDEIKLCDNGIISINLPQSSQNIGTMLSRSTHPLYISKVSELVRDILGRELLRFNNTFLFKTKKEVVRLIGDAGYPELLQETVSCAHIEGKTSQAPHCGVCSQCIDRRFSTVAANLENHDLTSRYEHDIFLEELSQGENRTHAENYVRFALKLEELDAVGLFAHYPELLSCLPRSAEANATAESIFNLFRRHQATVNSVIDKKIAEHAAELRRGVLPPNCLLSLVASRQLKVDPRLAYANRLGELLANSLPAVFQTVPAKDERHVQDAGQAIFAAATKQLRRETPQLPFSSVSTKPDFSKLLDKKSLYVEFKYPKDRRRLNHVLTEITSRIMIYTRQGASALFIVYDPRHTIVDEEAFRADLEQDLRIRVRIIR